MVARDRTGFLDDGQTAVVEAEALAACEGSKQEYGSGRRGLESGTSAQRTDRILVGGSFVWMTLLWKCGIGEGVGS